MNDLEYKKQILDTKSSSFCGAKWYNATIWLGSGMTTSCHGYSSNAQLHTMWGRVMYEMYSCNIAKLTGTPTNEVF